jgi:hypothetical protein
VLSTIENQRKKEAQRGEKEYPRRDMSGELQTIPARHGVATFVPRGRTIKIINTYGKQVISTWAFSLAAPPDEDEAEDEEEDIEEKTKELTEEVSQENEKDGDGDVGTEESQENTAKVEDEVEKPKEDAGKAASSKGQEGNENEKEAEDPPEQAPEEAQKTTETTDNKKQPEKRTWASYLPSIPYRSKGNAGKTDAKSESKTEKAKNEEASKKWSSYFPTGQSFSSYVPSSVQIPDSKGVTSAFKASFYRDTNKSYAEQLYDFSKTPVGAGTIAGQ